MSSPPVRFGLIGDSPSALAYSEAVRQTTGMAPVVAPVDVLLNDPAITAVIVAGSAAEDTAAVAATLAADRRVLIDPAMLGALGRTDLAREWSRRSDGSLLVARPWRFHDVYRSLRATVDAGDLGPPALFQWVSEGATTRLAGDDAGPTSAIQLIIGLDLAQWLLGGRPTRIYARPTGSDGVAISLRFSGGTNALLELRPRLANTSDSFGFAWLLGPRGEARWEQRADNLIIDQHGARFAPLDFRPCLPAAVAHAIACWQDGADLDAEAAPTRHLLAAVSAVNESLRRGQPVEIRADGEDIGQ